MAALRHPDRLCEIDLHVTSSMLASIVEVAQSLRHPLESIRITVEAPTGPPILVQNPFLGGSAPHLRQLQLDGIAFPFPAVRQVLLSSENLVELHLGRIPNEAYFSPNDLVTGLSTAIQLRRLTIDFYSPSRSPPSSTTPPPLQRTTLPSLISLDFHGESEYLEEFVAGIEVPALSKIAIRLFSDIDLEIPQFCQLILRLNALKSPTRVIVKHTVDFVGVYFEEGQPLLPLRENCFLGTSCKRLDWQLSFVTQILDQLSPLLSSVQSLDIQSGSRLPTGEEDVDTLELFQPLTHVTELYVWGQLVPSTVRALAEEDMTVEVLPELTLLHLSGHDRFPSVAKTVEQFVETRELSGRTVSLTFNNKVRRCSS
jgi:hypothetical protein